MLDKTENGGINLLMNTYRTRISNSISQDKNGIQMQL